MTHANPQNRFPRELDIRLGRNLSNQEVEKFAREDPKVKAHLEVIRRKELLELVLGKMEGLRELDVQEKARRSPPKKDNREGKGERKGWLF